MKIYTKKTTAKKQIKIGDKYTCAISDRKGKFRGFLVGSSLKEIDLQLKDTKYQRYGEPIHNNVYLDLN